jgi:hypothetical protein
MATESRTLDPAKVKAGGERIFGYLKGMGVSAMIYLGDKLGSGSIKPWTVPGW